MGKHHTHTETTVIATEGSDTEVLVDGHSKHKRAHHHRQGHHHHHHYEEYDYQDPDKHLKRALWCSCLWILLAIALVITAICTSFWYYGHVESNGADLAYTYGLLNSCYYESNGNGESWDTDDDGWVCHKWQNTATHDHDVLTDDCKDGSTVGLAFSIIGLILTFPVAVLCLIVSLWFVCDHRTRFKVFHILALVFLSIGLVCFTFAPSFFASVCDDQNQHFKWVRFTGPFTGTQYAPLDYNMQPHYSLIVAVVAIFFLLVALVCYIYFYLEWSKAHVHHYYHDQHVAHVSGDAEVVVVEETKRKHKKHHKHHDTVLELTPPSSSTDVTVVDAHATNSKHKHRHESPSKVTVLSTQPKSADLMIPTQSQKSPRHKSPRKSNKSPSRRDKSPRKQANVTHVTPV